ncbi:MAG: hypothetical protein CMO55_17075 [Verrucomicrobiales bacterium]|nr:hypothetical protein [Verrucomicrobiales bacterium]
MKINYIILSVLFVFSGVLRANSFNLPVPVGTIKGAHVDYEDSDTVRIVVGYGECSGYYWEVTSVAMLDITVTPGADDAVYFYIDHSASSYPSPSFYDSLTEPVWSDSAQGWYDGEDRCVGAILYENATSSLKHTRRIGDVYYFASQIVLDDNVNPDGTYNATTKDVDDYAPVMTYAVEVEMYGQDGGDKMAARAHAVANPYSIAGISGYHKGQATGWLYTGSGDRSIEIIGENDDENVMKCRMRGYRFERDAENDLEE